jgi:muconolactone delta-isomerase
LHGRRRDEIRNQLVRTPARFAYGDENAQKRILEVFGQWKAPANFKIEFFVVRVGEWGGHMLVDCDDPLTIHKVCSMLPAFVFQVHPVIRVEDAVRGELEVIAWRDGLKGK